MRKHRFFIAADLALNSAITLDADISHHINRVLRLQVGDPIFLFNNTGTEYTANIHSISRNAVVAEILSANTDVKESLLQINLAQVISKGEKMDFLVQKATELGVHSITPIISERTVVKKITERSEHKMEHWQKIAIAASGQSWRNVVPNINPPQALNTWITQTNNPHKLILSPTANSKPLNSLSINSTVTVLIGPEGGFSESELHLSLEYGFTPISLGPRILRTETAGIAIVAILQAMYGDAT